MDAAVETKTPPRPIGRQDVLPAAARTKLIALAGAATDARDAAQSAQVRYADLRQLDYTTMAPEKAGGVETEMSRLLAVRAQQNHRHGQLTALVSTIEHWLQTLPPNAAFDLAKPVTVKRLKDETLSQAITRTRDEIAALRQHLQAVKSAPLPKSDLKAEARVYIDGLAQLGRPKISGNGSKLSIAFPDTGNFGPLTIKAVTQMQAWLHGNLMIEAIEKEIDALPEPKLALSVKEKETRVRELKANLDGIERAEEALIEQAIAAGQDVLRRTDASPLAVLGLKFKNKVERVRTQ